MTESDLLKLAEKLEADADELDATREEFLDQMGASLNRLRAAGGLPPRDLRAEVETKKAAKAKPRRRS